MPPVCKFWQQGNCRFGDQCRFDHPVNRGGFTNNGNRFEALANSSSNSNSNPRNNNNYQSGSSSATGTLPYMLDKNAILTDLTTEKPQWILSAYGPGRHAPAQLFGGPVREQSFEEMRVQHYKGLVEGRPQQVVQEAESLAQQAEQQMQTAVNNIDSAIQYLINSENEHPNRIDICKAGQEGPGAQPNPLGSSTPFGAPSNSGTFGAASQRSTTPAFGAPSVPTGAFGQPSQLGSKPNPFGASGPAFGGPSQLGTGAFGQPAQLGQKVNPFGAPPTNSGFSAFAGASTSFGQPATSGAFGAPSQTATSGAFGASSQQVTSGSFGVLVQPTASNTFGAPSQPAASSPFSAPAQPATSNPFSAPTQPAPVNTFIAPSNPSPFGAPSQPAQQNPFGAASAAPFGTPLPAAANPFGASSQQNPSPFGQPAAVGSSNANPFGNPPNQPSSFTGFTQPTPAGPRPTNGFTHGTSSGQQGDVNSYSTRDASGRLLSWKNRRVVYKDQTPGFTNQAGKWEKIWFPNGPPAPDPQAFLPAEAYDQSTKDQYEYARQHGMFKDGIMPLMPPMLEVIKWDF